MLNLDTHVAVAVLNGDLNRRELDLVSLEPLAISAIVLWELAKLVQLKRLIMDLEGKPFHAFLRQITIVPITWEIARHSTLLDIRSDPADEIIGATSLVEQMPLLTRDKKLLKSRMIPLA